MEQALQSDLPVEGIDAIKEGSLYSKDLAPVPSNARKWGTKDIAFLWVGMLVAGDFDGCTGQSNCSRANDTKWARGHEVWDNLSCLC